MIPSEAVAEGIQITLRPGLLSPSAPISVPTAHARHPLLITPRRHLPVPCARAHPFPRPRAPHNPPTSFLSRTGPDGAPRPLADHRLPAPPRASQRGTRAHVLQRHPHPELWRCRLHRRRVGVHSSPRRHKEVRPSLGLAEGVGSLFPNTPSHAESVTRRHLSAFQFIHSHTLCSLLTSHSRAPSRSPSRPPNLTADHQPTRSVSNPFDGAPSEMPKPALRPIPTASSAHAFATHPSTHPHEPTISEETSAYVGRSVSQSAAQSLQRHSSTSRAYSAAQPTASPAPAAAAASALAPPNSSTGAPYAAPSSSSKRRQYRQVGDWILQKTLGQGSMGKVKLGINVRSQERVRNKLRAYSKLTLVCGQDCSPPPRRPEQGCQRAEQGREQRDPHRARGVHLTASPPPVHLRHARLSHPPESLLHGVRVH